MPPLPRFLATTPPPRESGLARATDIGALTRTGDIAVWRGVSRVGQAMQYGVGLGFRAYQNRKALDDDIRWGTQTQETERAITEAENAAKAYDYTVDMPLPDDPDFGKDPLELSVEKRESLINDALKDLDKKAANFRRGFPTEEGKAKYNLWYGDKRLIAEESLKHEYGLKHDEYQRGRLNKLWQDAAKAGDVETANSYIAAMDKNELITLDRANQYRRQAAEIAEQQEILLAINFAAATLSDDDIKNASDMIEKSKVFATEAEKAQFRGQLKSVLNNARTLRNEQIEVQREEAIKQIVDLTKDNSLTTHEVEKRRNLIKSGDYKTWMNVALTGKHILDESDPQIERIISDAIAFDPQSIDSKHIRSFVGKGKNGGLSLAKAEEYELKWQQSMDKASPVNTPVAKNYFKMLKGGETDRIFSLDKTTNSIIYGQTLNQLTDYFINYRAKNDRDPTEEEAQSFYEGLVTAYRKPESPFTEARVQQMLGELQSGGAVSIYGIVMPFRKAEDAINHALRTLGPDWQKIAPESARIIKQNWPEAKLKVVEPTPKTEFEIGQRIIHPNGGTYEYTGETGDKAWRLVKE